MRTILIFIVAAIVATAGCIGGSDDAPVESASANVTAGGAASGLENTAMPEGAVAAEKVEKAVPYAVDGKLGRSACVPSGPNSCNGLPVAIGSSASFFDTELSPIKADLVMTWEAETPVTATLILQSLAMKSCGDGCFEGRGLESVKGTSPLAYSASGLALEQGEILMIHVMGENRCHSQAVVYGCAAVLEQAFHIEGTLTVLE